MSKHRKTRCAGHETGLHSYKRFLTNNGKPVWHCVECSSYANFDAILIFNKARCSRCGIVFPLSFEALHQGEAKLTTGASIFCMQEACGAREKESKRKDYAEKLAGDLAAKLMKSLPEELPSRSDSEQEGDSLLSSMMKGDGQ